MRLDRKINLTADKLLTDETIVPQSFIQENFLNNHYATYYTFKHAVGIRLFHTLTLNQNIRFDSVDEKLDISSPQMGILQDHHSKLYHLVMQRGEKEILLANALQDKDNLQEGKQDLWVYTKGGNILVAKNANGKQVLHMPTHQELKTILTTLESCY